MNTRDRTDIYWRRTEIYERQMILFNQWQGSKINKQLILDFQDYLFAKGTKKVRISKLIGEIRNICDWLAPLNLNEVTKKDLEKLISKLQQKEEYKDSTKSDYKRCLKQFYNWFEDEDPRLNKESDKNIEAISMYKYLKKHIKTTYKVNEHDPTSIITDKDIKFVLKNGCINDMERACISLLHETGCRVGELLGIRIKDLIPKDTHWLVYVSGKTGERSVPFRDSIPYLLRWLDIHPTNNPDDYLWISIQGRHNGNPLRYVGIQRILQRCFKKAKINKKINPHWFRHSRSTLDATKYNEVILCKLRGWIIGSSMSRRYTHLSGKDTENAYLQVRGIKKADEIQQLDEPITCICGRLNESESKYCSACGKALRMDIVIKENEYLEKAFNLLGIISSNPELKKQFDEFKKTIN
jgi:integrase/recombinase XerD